METGDGNAGWATPRPRVELATPADIRTAHRKSFGVPFRPSRVPYRSKREVVVLVVQGIREVLEIFATGGWRLGL